MNNNNKKNKNDLIKVKKINYEVVQKLIKCYFLRLEKYADVILD